MPFREIFEFWHFVVVDRSVYGIDVWFQNRFSQSSVGIWKNIIRCFPIVFSDKIAPAFRIRSDNIGRSFFIEHFKSANDTSFPSENKLLLFIDFISIIKNTSFNECYLVGAFKLLKDDFSLFIFDWAKISQYVQNESLIIWIVPFIISMFSWLITIFNCKEFWKVVAEWTKKEIGVKTFLYFWWQLF